MSLFHVQGAMLMGLSDMGLGANVFDAVYGASAGAINSTYYLSGEQQQRLRCSVFDCCKLCRWHGLVSCMHCQRHKAMACSCDPIACGPATWPMHVFKPRCFICKALSSHHLPMFMQHLPTPCPASWHQSHNAQLFISCAAPYPIPSVVCCLSLQASQQVLTSTLTTWPQAAASSP
jgi:hypothetical protein